MKYTLICLWLVLFNISTLALAENFGWRGDGSGTYPNANPPTTWSADTNVLWKAELPGRAYASPVLCNGRVFVLAEPNHVMCLDADKGNVLWQQSVDYAVAVGDAKAAEIEATQARFDREKKNIKKQYDELRRTDPASDQLVEQKQQQREIDQRRKEYEKQFPRERRGGAGNAAATPVCDGSRLFIAFGTGIVAAFDLDGKRLWARHLEAPRQSFGHSASPALAVGKLIVHYQDLVALDPSDGKELWRTEIPAKFGSPVVVRIDGQDVIVSPAGALVRAADGHILADKLFKLSNNSPLVHEGVVYAHESGSIRALRLPTSLEHPVEIKLLWESSSTRDQRMASAAYQGGLLFAGGRRGILDVTDAKTGTLLYRKRLDLGDLFSSIAVAGSQVFISGKDGRTLVIKAEREYEEVGVNETGRLGSTPIFSGDRMYLRTDKYLYCIYRNTRTTD